MDSTIHALIVAHHAQARIAEATSERLARDARGQREPKPRHARRWLTRHARAVAATPETPRTISALPPT